MKFDKNMKALLDSAMQRRDRRIVIRTIRDIVLCHNLKTVGMAEYHDCPDPNRADWFLTDKARKMLGGKNTKCT